MGFISLVLQTSLCAALKVSSVSFLGFKAASHPSLQVTDISSSVIAIKASSSSSNFSVVQKSPLAVIANAAPALTTAAVAYPNPFKFSSGTTLGYRLSKDLDIEIHVYDMAGHLVYKRFIPAGSDGGSGGLYNKVLISENMIGYKPSTGVYFFFIVNAGKVLGKGKVLAVL